MSSSSDRLRGIAVGAAVGDALGMSLEFKPPSSPFNLITEMRAGDLPVGTFTDDTEMALALAESLLVSSPLDGHDLAGRFTAWYQSRPSDVGMHTARVLRMIAQGTSWEEAAQIVLENETEEPSNGALMRCWPLALARWQNQALLVAETRLQSEVTDKHPDAVNAAIFLNLVLQKIVLREGTSHPDAVLRAAVSESIRQVSFSDEMKRAVELAPMRQREDLKNSDWALCTLESALWAVYTTRSFEEALVQAVNLGEDADTAGCVAGAIAGAIYGLDAIPARWKDQLHGEYPLRSGHIWLAADFINLADQLSMLSQEV